MSEDPMDTIARLGRLLGQRTEEIGLEMQSFIPMVNLEEDGKHFVQAVFLIEGSAIVAAVADADDDEAQLAGILAATAEAEQEAARELEVLADAEKAESAKERMLALRDRLDRGEGLLD